MSLLPAIKMNKPLIPATTWINLKIIVLKKARQKREYIL